MNNSFERHIDTKHKLVMGTLLHDIGKLVQRANEYPTSMTHGEFGARWLENRDCLAQYSDFARYHHDPKEYEEAFLLSFVHLADWLAAGERGDSEEAQGSWERDIVLLSLFSKITLEDRKEAESELNNTLFDARYYDLVPASELIFPKKFADVEIKGTAENYRRLLEGLENDLRILKNNDNVGVNSMLFLLEKYLSYVPSYTRRAKGSVHLDPDISLFDHSKLAAAIALCLFCYCSDMWGEDMGRWEPEKFDFILSGLGAVASEEKPLGLKDEKAFLLIDINLSGIQNFIYNISTKKAAKSLRSRSFYLEMLCEDLADEVLRRCGLERTNLLFAGGGRVKILAPNLKTVKNILGDVELESNTFLSHLGGILSVSLSWVELRGTDMVISTATGSELPKILRTLSEKAELNKYTRPAKLLVHGMEIGPFDPLLEECRICHVETNNPARLEEEGEEPVFVCPTCDMLIKLGGYLKEDHKGNSRFVYIQKKETEPGPCIECLELPFGKLTWRAKPENLRLALVLEGRWNPASYLSPEYAGFAFPAHTPGSATFEELADESVGASRLGVLRMDVDDLGKIFTKGIPEKEMSFTRYSVLSRMLNRYFREYLPLVAEGKFEGGVTLPIFDRPKDKIRAAEIIYSGGDDLFLVGAWNDLLEIAFDISYSFKLFVCENPALHISGGLVVHRHDHPLYRLAGLSQEEEDKAKAAEGKDNFCLFQRTAKWDKYLEIFENVLMPLLTSGNGEKAELKPFKSGEDEKVRHYIELTIPRALLHRLLQLFRDCGQPEWKLNLPILSYVLYRAREGLEKMAKEEKWVEKKHILEKLEKLEMYLKNFDKAETNFAALCCVDLLTRGGFENGK